MRRRAKALFRRFFGGPAPGPQLLMWYEKTAPPPPPPLAPQFVLRRYGPGDEQGWCQLLSANGQLGVWQPERLQAEMHSQWARDGQIFAVRDGQIVASAGVYERELAGRRAWEIGWVATHPRYQSQGLGTAVTVAAVKAALGFPPRPIGLRTDDFRLPAIKVYLRLGFVPDLVDPSYRARWALIGQKLGPEFASLLAGKQSAPPGQDRRLKTP